MITKKEILKMVTHVTKRAVNIPDRKLIHPDREWAIGLLACFLFLVAGFVYNAQRFSYFNSIEAHLTESSSGIVKYNRSDLENVLQHFDEQTVKFQQLRNGIEPAKYESISFDTPVVTSSDSELDSNSADSPDNSGSVTDPLPE